VHCPGINDRIIVLDFEMHLVVVYYPPRTLVICYPTNDSAAVLRKYLPRHLPGEIIISTFRLDAALYSDPVANNATCSIIPEITQLGQQV
jgi:hypothetical protein